MYKDSYSYVNKVFCIHLWNTYLGIVVSNDFHGIVGSTLHSVEEHFIPSM